MGTNLGPFVRKLIAHRMSRLMIPPGTPNPLATGMSALTKPENLIAVAREAAAWVELALAVVKTAPDNPYGDDNEAIAKAVLEKIEERLLQRYDNCS